MKKVLTNEIIKLGGWPFFIYILLNIYLSFVAIYDFEIISKGLSPHYIYSASRSIIGVLTFFFIIFKGLEFSKGIVKNFLSNTFSLSEYYFSLWTFGILLIFSSLLISLTIFFIYSESISLNMEVLQYTGIYLLSALGSLAFSIFFITLFKRAWVALIICFLYVSIENLASFYFKFIYETDLRIRLPFSSLCLSYNQQIATNISDFVWYIIFFFVFLFLSCLILKRSNFQ